MRLLLLRIVFAIYLVAVGFVVWTPEPDAEAVSGLVGFAAGWLVDLGIPFATVYAILEFAANIAMFVPFGILAMTAYSMRVWSATLAGLATSALIEAVQLALPERFATLQDVVANTSGALIGALVVATWRSRRARSQRPPSSD
ncbi:VanZ family protein [Homoserinibacter sp. GY 40078]|uniref:VanZ family protein n=1 Tax=Homoserinibacter sp. GY 40078 TaxID=2603275 RepID=UPI0011CA310E|nr:VanZ family protein [Homoserinibacter sp. GY 40078]TXK17433.1 VanZ family protein [Homoserinibacter sp. GY 40078]